jgi:L-alanine-DL-glutamate epimerase-like enolase superfamily enzyme
MRVMVDCNQGWRMPWDTAQPWSVDRVWPFAAGLAELGVFWIEEPLDRGDYDGMAELRRRLTGSGLLVAGGEMTREPYEFRELLTRGCLDVYQPDVVCTNGVSGLAALARRVLDAGHLFTPHTWGNGIGVLANLHLAAGVAGEPGSAWVEWPYDPPEWSVDRRDFPLVSTLDEALGLEGGRITLPDRPGLGVDLDHERLARTRSGAATFG